MRNLTACRAWIKTYMKPSKYVNHMHTSTELRLMMEDDTNEKVSDSEFKKLAMEAGFDPVNGAADEWEFSISPAPLRRRAKAKVVGWLPTKNYGRLTRMG